MTLIRSGDGTSRTTTNRTEEPAAPSAASSASSGAAERPLSTDGIERGPATGRHVETDDLPVRVVEKPVA